MSDDRIDLGEIKRRAQAAYGGRRRPASPSEVLALVEAVEAARETVHELRTIAPMTPHIQGCDAPDDPFCPRCVLDSEVARAHDALARFDFEEKR